MLAGCFGIWATCSLGFWQLRRAAGKEVLQQHIDAAANAAPSAPDVAQLHDSSTLVQRHVTFRGRWVPSHVVYLDNRPLAGQAGLYVLMGLAVERPFATEIVVDRGWIPRDPADRSRIAPYRTPGGPVAVTGVALAEEPRLLELAAPGARPLGGIWQNFDFDAYNHAAGEAPVRLIVREDPGDASGPPDGLSRDWPDRGGTLQGQIDRHHGYAFQWFAMAAALAAFLLYRIVRFFRPSRHVRPILR